MSPREYLEHFQARVLQDALNEATGHYWIRRAEQFEAARPTLGEYHGKLTADELRAKWLELTEIAKACRARAAVARWDELEPTIQQVLRGVA